ncbi:MAG: hypothetical protein A2X94_01110 [Bdellovibrionales bacterium GWB1_55_8]|nr:MAG: hypothetical protein A2X94_01110 [Bdellovibrionales bacterium GWB1_55_8]
MLSYFAMRRISPLSNLPTVAFRSVLGDASRIVVICHTDLDGFGAARILKDSSFGRKVAEVLATDSPDRDVREEEVELLLAANPDLIVFLDIAPSNQEQLQRLLAGRKGLVVDHHKPKEFERFPQLDARFVSYRLFPEGPDHYSATLLMAELLGEPYNPELVVAALLGDENFGYFRDRFECTEEELRMAYDVGKLYKKLGAVQPLRAGDEFRADQVANILRELALSTPDLDSLSREISSNPLIQKIITETSEDTARLMQEALEMVSLNWAEQTLLLEFVPAAGFCVAGFIYLLERRIREAVPEFRGVLVLAQEGEGFWRLDGLSTEQEISAGEIFAHSGVGGGHHNVGGGRLMKRDGTHPRAWFEKAYSTARAKKAALSTL